MKNYLFILCLLMLACGREKSRPKDESSVTDRPSIDTEGIYFTGDIVLNEDSSEEIDLKAYIAELKNDKSTIEEVEAPSWFFIDKKLKIAKLRPDKQGEFLVKLEVKQNQKITIESLVIGVNGDPLKDESWHLVNTGQRSFSSHRSAIGFDSGLKDVHSFGADGLYSLTGKGVRIAVSDTTVEMMHPDLKQNILFSEHKNYRKPFPYNSSLNESLQGLSSAHGTAVAGIIAAVGFNNIGSIGIAPESSIASLQFLNSMQTTEIMIDQASGSFDIFNYSYGDTIFHDTESDSAYIDHLRWASRHQRFGKGSFHIKAAGNEFVNIDRSDGPVICTSHNANAPFENESPYLITIGAINSQGLKASYSSVGSNIWISAPGGEDGVVDAAIITTDLTNCYKGYSRGDSFQNAFERGEVALNQNCQYTSTMNGTSSATPIVSGAIALILEANPSLSYREVKHILAVTSRRIDAKTQAWPSKKHISQTTWGKNLGCADLSLSGYTYETGWIRNQSGRWFHNYYGFGLLDIKKAVELAQDFDLDPMSFLPLAPLVEMNSDFENKNYEVEQTRSIPDNNKNGVLSKLEVSEDIIVEQVQIKVDIEHSASGEVGIELISPAGTKSIIKYINDSFLLSKDRDLSMVFLSNAFYGERSSGEWSLKVVDALPGNRGKLLSWKINILGHKE